MKEIEVKARIKDARKIIERLKNLGGTLSLPIQQVDTVYTKIIGKVEDYIRNDHFLRIRETSDGRFVFTVKKPLYKEVLTKAEHETEFKDSKELERGLLLMGYQVASKVIKSRKIAHVSGFEICIDDVTGLGSFIEIEKMSDGDVVLVRKELNEFLASLGVSPDDQVYKGYDIMEIESRII